MAKIIGIGTWLPPHVRDNSHWPPGFGSNTSKTGDRTFNDIEAPRDPKAAAIVAKYLAMEDGDPFLGAVRRHVAGDDTTCLIAERFASTRALIEADTQPEDVDLILCNAMVPERISPASGPALAHLIGAKNAQAIHVDTVCASAITQIEMARAYIDSGLATNVLCVQSHLMLRTVASTHPASPGLGDAATAMVISGSGKGLEIRSTFGVTHGEDALTVTWIRGSDDETDPAWWKSGSSYRLGSRNPSRVKILMRDTVMFGSDTIRTAAHRAGLPISDIDVLVSVQPRGFIPGAIAEHLGLPNTRAVDTYTRIAHVGVCGPVFNLAEARQIGRLTPGAYVAMYAQGAGFTRAAAILEVE